MVVQRICNAKVGGSSPLSGIRVEKRAISLLKESEQGGYSVWV